MCKKLFLILIILVATLSLFAVDPISVETNKIRLENAREALVVTKYVVSSVKAIGWKAFLFENWYFVLMSLFGLLSVAVIIIPGKTDDEFFKKYIMPIYNATSKIGNVLGLKKKINPKKPQ
jgi:hypothetical protein